jgi:hypothetical protein
MMNVPSEAWEGERPVVLVAVEPRVYACAIGETIGRLRPGLDVKTVEPDDLADEIPRLCPRLVFCSRPRVGTGRDGDPVWVEFYPYAEAPPRVMVRADGWCSTLEDVDLDGLLGIVDSQARWPVFREGKAGRLNHRVGEAEDWGRREACTRRKPGARKR